VTAQIPTAAIGEHYVKPSAPMTGVPARQTGWRRESGEWLSLPAVGEGGAVCLYTGTGNRRVAGHRRWEENHLCK
jgi:hypothetical protein